MVPILCVIENSVNLEGGKVMGTGVGGVWEADMGNRKYNQMEMTIRVLRHG